LLPRWRGAAPIQRAILAGDEVTGVTIMRMEEGLDTGPMLLKRETAIGRKTAGDLTEELAKLGRRGAGRVARQSDTAGPAAGRRRHLCVKIDKAEARIDWSRERRGYRAAGARLSPLPRCLVRGERRADQSCSKQNRASESGAPGRSARRPLTIACGGRHPPLKVQRAGQAR
jgi:methionyl-tRNA formyltransferase